MNNNIIDQGRSTLESAMQIHTTKSGIPLPVEQKKKMLKLILLLVILNLILKVMI